MVARPELCLRYTEVGRSLGTTPFNNNEIHQREINFLGNLTNLHFFPFRLVGHEVFKSISCQPDVTLLLCGVWHY